MASEPAGSDAIPSVTAGVIFGAPVALPRGPQALPRADVLAEQRERLLAAMTELIAAGGYARVRVGALASCAGVSRTAFYQCFANKEACAFAAYDRFIEVLLRALRERAVEQRPDDLAALIGGLLDAYFSVLERDLVAARAFLVEFDALGPPARQRRRLALDGIAAYVRQMHEEFRASDPTIVPAFEPDIYVGILYIARQLACDALDHGGEPPLRTIGDMLAPWLLTAFQPGATPPEELQLLDTPESAS